MKKLFALFICFLCIDRFMTYKIGELHRAVKIAMHKKQQKYKETLRVAKGLDKRKKSDKRSAS